MGKSVGANIEHMSDLSPAEQLLALLAMEKVQVDDLARTRHWITKARQRVADEQKPTPPPRRAEAARAPLPRPPLVTETRHGRPPILHGPDCWIRNDGFGTLPIDADSAREQLASAVVEACDICRPDTGLGVL